MLTYYSLSNNILIHFLSKEKGNSQKAHIVFNYSMLQCICEDTIL